MLAAFSGYLENFFSPYLDLKYLWVKMWICYSQQVQNSSYFVVRIYMLVKERNQRKKLQLNQVSWNSGDYLIYLE